MVRGREHLHPLILLISWSSSFCLSSFHTAFGICKVTSFTREVNFIASLDLAAYTNLTKCSHAKYIVSLYMLSSFHKVQLVVAKGQWHIHPTLSGILWKNDVLGAKFLSGTACQDPSLTAYILECRCSRTLISS